MGKIIDSKEYLSLTLSALREGKTNLPVTVSGTSMVPFLRPGDVVFLNLPNRPCRVGDVVLFTRPDGSYVLHRIIRTTNTHYILQGDGQLTPEPVPISQVCAVVTSLRLGNRLITPHHPYWLFFRTLWRWLRPLRPMIGKLHKKSR